MPAWSIALAGTSAAAVSAGGGRTRVRAMAADHLVTARKLQRAEGPATILSLGTANPPTARDQSTYPDYYFSLTGCDQMLELKNKFQRICGKTAIKKRHTILTDEILADNPELLTYMSPSLDARQRIAATAIPEMAAAASTRAIDDWGGDSSSITHLLLCTTSLTGLPGADYQLHHLLGLRPSVQRLMLPLHGCHGSASVLRVAKDIAENNRGARVLAVCAETTAVVFRGPSEADPGILVRMALFGDGAAAVVVGADLTPSERPIFRMVSAAQTVVAGSGGGIAGEVKEAGLVYELERGVPALIGANVGRVVEEGLGVGEWNSAFWAVHPGGRAILDAVESELRLTEGKLAASRKVLEEYGNMASPTVFFVLDEMRRRSAAEGLGTTGEGCERGMLLGFGPGLTIASLVLESVDLS